VTEFQPSWLVPFLEKTLASVAIPGRMQNPTASGPSLGTGSSYFRAHDTRRR
jgi:hypothetical protein